MHDHQHCRAENHQGGAPALEINEPTEKGREENKEIILNILKGKEKGPKRDIVVLNAAVALFTAGKAPDIKDGIALAKESIDTGKALEKLEALRKFTN